MPTLVYEGIEAFYSSKGLTSLPWCRVLFLIGIFMSIFFGILSLQESFLLTPNMEHKIFLYICKCGDQAWPRQGHQLRLLPHRGRQPHQGRQLCLLRRQLRLLPRQGHQLRLLPRQSRQPRQGRQSRLLPRRGHQLCLFPSAQQCQLSIYDKLTPSS